MAKKFANFGDKINFCSKYVFSNNFLYITIITELLIYNKNFGE